MRLILLCLVCCNIDPSLTALPSSCRNIEFTSDREILTLDSGMKVMCDTQTDGGGWIIIQRRINGQIPFYRKWEAYRNGFGDYSIGEFYLCNENIYQLTSKGHYELRIDLKFKNKTYYASYSHFRITGEYDNYKIQLLGYSGNAGDNLLEQHNNIPFSTSDKDNDNFRKVNCAETRQGGWWYDACHFSHLNGVWGSTDYAKGVIWFKVTGDYASATFTEMKIREVEL